MIAVGACELNSLHLVRRLTRSTPQGLALVLRAILEACLWRLHYRLAVRHEDGDLFAGSVLLFYLEAVHVVSIVELPSHVLAHLSSP